MALSIAIDKLKSETAVMQVLMKFAGEVHEKQNRSRHMFYNLIACIFFETYSHAVQFYVWLVRIQKSMLLAEIDVPKVP